MKVKGFPAKHSHQRDGFSKKGVYALAGMVQWLERQFCKPEGCWFNSQSGHKPELWASSPVGGE